MTKRLIRKLEMAEKTPRKWDVKDRRQNFFEG